MNTLSVNGIDLAYEDRGDGPPLLLLHGFFGFFGSSGDWVHLFDLDELFVAQYRAIPNAALYVIPNGDAVFRAARPDFVRTALAFLRG